MAQAEAKKSEESKKKEDVPQQKPPANLHYTDKDLMAYTNMVVSHPGGSLIGQPHSSEAQPKVT